MSIAFTAGLVVVAIVVALLASRRSGPRITIIEHRHDMADEPKDGDNA